MDVNEYKLENEKRWSQMSLDIQEVKDSIKHQKEEVDSIKLKLEKQGQLVSDIQKLGTSVSILANNMKSMLEEQQSQNKRLQELEQKPAKRWDSIIDRIIMLIVAALVGAVLVKLGIN